MLNQLLYFNQFGNSIIDEGRVAMDYNKNKTIFKKYVNCIVADKGSESFKKFIEALEKPAFGFELLNGIVVIPTSYFNNIKQIPKQLPKMWINSKLVTNITLFSKSDVINKKAIIKTDIIRDTNYIKTNESEIATSIDIANAIRKSKVKLMTSETSSKYSGILAKEVLNENNKIIRGIR